MRRSRSEGGEFVLLPEDAEAVIHDIDFCISAGDYDVAREQLGRLMDLLSRYRLV